MAKKPTNPLSTNPVRDLPPEVAQALRDRGNIPASSAAALPVHTQDDALAKLEAMTQELLSMDVQPMQHSDRVAAVGELAAGVTDLPSLPVPEIVQKQLITDVTVGQRKKEPTVRLSMPNDRFNPNNHYVELPPDFASFVHEHTALKAAPAKDGAITSAEQYFTEQAELRTLVETLPATIPAAPIGWDLTWQQKFANIDPRDLLKQSAGSTVVSYQERLTDLIRWCLTVQRGVQGEQVQAAIRNLEVRALAADQRLQRQLAEPMLNKFVTLLSLVQTPAFAGKPELLAEMLIADWSYIEKAVAYRTPLAELSSIPALYHPDTMTPAAFTRAGSLSSFSVQHSQRLIDEYRLSSAARDRQYSTVDITYLQKHAFLYANRVRAEVDSPVLIQFGYQEQLPGGSRMDTDGVEESWRDVVALEIISTHDGVTTTTGNIPGDSSLGEAAASAVMVLQLLDKDGK